MRIPGVSEEEEKKSKRDIHGELGEPEGGSAQFSQEGRVWNGSTAMFTESSPLKKDLGLGNRAHCLLWYQVCSLRGQQRSRGGKLQA